MERAAVITGDIVRSRSLGNRDRENVTQTLKKTFSMIANRLFQDSPYKKLEFFRGDSFQAIISEPQYALRVSILLRAKLRSLTKRKETKPKRNNSKAEQTSPQIWDSRVAIGIGEISFKSKQAISSDGTAFLLSGNALDQMKNKEDRLRVETPDKNFNEEFYIQLLLADSIIRRWTVAQSEAAFHYLLEYNKTQVELAKTLKISQSSLSRRILSGSIDVIHLLCQRFEILIPQVS